MASSYDRYERNSRRRGTTLTSWLPLALTVTAATIGIAAWIWSERNDEDEDELPPPPGPPGGPNDGIYGRNPDGSVRTAPPSYADVRPGEAAYGTIPGPYPAQEPPRHEESQSFMARMSGALRRSPSPQQMFEGASRSVVGGITAAGAVVGSALGRIMEEDKNAYKDHERWSEEAEARHAGASPGAEHQGIEMRSESEPKVAPVQQVSGKRKTVAIVVSADSGSEYFEDEGEEFHEHASILSALPRNTDFTKVKLFVLIYAPGLKEHPLDAVTPKPPGSLSSSFSLIGQEQAQSPDKDKNQSSNTPSPIFNAVYAQALALVEKETMVLPFTTPTGHVHILRHLGPDIVYLQESLAGENGEVITHLQTWLRQDVVLVVGANGGHGGLADSDSEVDPSDEKKEHWWEREERVGRGRGVVVVEGLRVGDDWARRIENKE